MAWNPPSGSGGSGAIVSGDPFGYQSAEKVRQSLHADAFAMFPLGGSRSVGIGPGGSPPVYVDAIDYLDFVVTDAKYAGFTWVAVVECLSGDPSSPVVTTITPKIRNVTDGSDAVIGAACDANEDFETQELTFTPTVGKKYRLMGVKSDDDNPAYLIGYVRRTSP